MPVQQLDFDFAPDGSVLAIHQIDTDDPEQLLTLVGLKNGTIDMTKSGWDVISKHPDYNQRTRYQVTLGEIVRTNDTKARAALGI